MRPYRTERLLYFLLCAPFASQRLPCPRAEFKSEPLNQIPQQTDCLITSWAVFGLGLGVPDPCDQSFRCFHSAGAAKQVERGSSILDSYPGSLFGAWVWTGRRVKTTVMKVAGGTDKTDRGVQLLITEPALMLLPSLQPAPSY